MKSSSPRRHFVSEITPRNDNKDNEVIECNKLFNSYASSLGNVFVARHSNLRDDQYTNFYDVKHLKETIIPRFASNIKRALVLAYGGRPWQRNTYQRNHATGNYNDPNSSKSGDFKNKMFDALKQVIENMVT